MKKFRIKLDTDRIIPVPGHWPATIFGANNEGIVVTYNTLAEAIHEVSDEYGVSAHVLTGHEEK